MWREKKTVKVPFHYPKPCIHRNGLYLSRLGPKRKREEKRGVEERLCVRYIYHFYNQAFPSNRGDEGEGERERERVLEEEVLAHAQLHHLI